MTAQEQDLKHSAVTIAECLTKWVKTNYPKKRFLSLSGYMYYHDDKEGTYLTLRGGETRKEALDSRDTISIVNAIIIRELSKSRQIIRIVENLEKLINDNEVG